MEEKLAFHLPDSPKFASGALAAASLGVVLSAAGFIVDKAHFFHSYLIAYAFWLTLALGALFFTMLHHLTGATWSVVLRRLSEILMSSILLLIFLFIPVLAGMGYLYHWSLHDVTVLDPALSAKASYLNTWFFIARTIIYFLVWAFLARSLYRISLAQDKIFDQKQGEKMKRISAPGMVLFAFTITFASFDWFMSLSPRWYSTVFGVYIFSGSLLAALAFITLLTIYLRRQGVLADVITVEHFHDLGKLTFTFTVFWGYIAFAQYFLIWYGNIPEETVWFRQRWGGWWQFLSLLLVFGHFVLPFLVLITRGAKRNISIMKFAAVWLLIMHWVDLYWVVMPNYPRNAVSLLWTDLGAMLAIGGLFLWFLRRRLSAGPLVPINDPRLEDSIQLMSD